MTEQKPKVFAKGVYFKKPEDYVPAFILSKVSIKAEDFKQFLDENANGAGYVNFSLKQPMEIKESNYFLELDTWKKPEEGSQGANLDDKGTSEPKF